ncbi:MAG TPA: autotransporter domain-containing protein [Caulobacterales bacterium]|nr:autotransporter domain-containing protein [Caulobacterales bacterium]
MRIRGVQLAGLAVVLAGAAAKDALANDLTISTATTTPVTTSAASGGTPGNVTVDTAGSITITAGQTAVTLDSPNSVTNLGAIKSNNVDTVTGVLITGTHTGTVNNVGSISLVEDYTLSDSDSDGDLDGAWQLNATSNRTGILLQSGSVFTGNINSSGVIGIEGGQSSGVRLDGSVVGNVAISGGISVTGDNSYGVAINGGATGGVSGAGAGNVSVTGGVSVTGQNSVGLLVDAPISGALNINGAWSVTGFHSTTHPTTASVISALDADDLQVSGSAIVVHYDVLGGMTLQGIGIENDTDDDGDGVTEAAGDTNDNATTSISVATSAPAIWITPDASTPASITLGNTGRGYGFVNRGSVAANGVYQLTTPGGTTGFSATALRIEGAGGASVSLYGGLLNDGTLSASAFEANTYGIYLGNLTDVPMVVTRGTIGSRSTSEGAFNAYGVFLGSTANTTGFNNSGTITAQVLGETGNAIAIADTSNKLATITNSGLIQAAVIATDSDVTDNIPAPPVTGSAIAIDVHTSSIGVTVNQVSDANNPLRDGNDDDTTDDVTPPLPQIFGSILFGSGADTLSLGAGQMVGDVSFGAGANAFSVNNGAAFYGRIANGGTLLINVANGALNVLGGTSNITSATFGAQGVLGVTLSETASENTFIHATGAVSFASGAVIEPILPTGLPASGAITFLTADGGFGGTETNVTRTLTGSSAPFVYNAAIQTVPGDGNSLEVNYTLKTAAQLGLNANQTAAFNPLISALRTDSAASAAFAGLHTSNEFFEAYANLMPNYAAGAAELATTAIQQGQSASTNRLAATRLSNARNVSVWAQEIGYGLEREPQTFGLRYRGSGFGFATGIDGPLDNGGLFGLSASFISSEVEEPIRKDGELAATFGQVGAYYGTSMGPIDLDFVGGLGVGKMRSRRFVDIGSDFERVAKAEWWAYEGHGIVRASAPMRSGAFTVTPQVQLSYVALDESGYTEEGGGTAIDYKVDGTLTQRLWADAAVEFGTRFVMGADTIVTPHLSLGYRANVLDNAADRTVRFVSGGSPFTLTDETTGSGAPLIGLGLDATNGYTTVTVAYEGEFGDEITRHSLNVALRFKF